MKKKEYLLRNRIIRAVLIAVLAQSIFFGATLLTLGGFSTLSGQPYQTMRVRLQDKNDVISNMMRQIYLEGIGLKHQMKRNTTEDEIHTMLIDVLNKTNYLSGIVYISTDGSKGVCYVDSEPQEYSVNASDISCVVGVSLADAKIGMSTKWQKDFSGDYAYIKALAEQEDAEDCWFYDKNEDDFYYKVYAGDHMLLMQLKGKNLNHLLEIGDMDTEMQFWLADSNGGFYTDKGDMTVQQQRY